MTTNPQPLRRSAPFVPFRTPVRGHVFAARPPSAEPPIPGQQVEFAREPSNPADPLAVAVWSSRSEVPWRLGYLAREVAARVAPRLDAGAEFEARLDGWVREPDGRWQRPVLAVFPVPDEASTPPEVARERPPATTFRTDERAAAALPGRPARSVRRRLPRRHAGSR